MKQIAEGQQSRQGILICQFQGDKRVCMYWGSIVSELGTITLHLLFAHIFGVNQAV